MANYRIYLMDWAGDHIEDFAPISASCDEDAIGAATRRADRQPTELWLGGRMVCRIAKRSARPILAQNYSNAMFQAGRNGGQTSLCL